MAELIHTLMRANKQQQECIRQLTHQLYGSRQPAFSASSHPLAALPPAVSAELDRRLNGESLFCPIAGNAKLAVVLSDASTGRMLDCNHQMCEICNMPTEAMTGTVMVRSYDDLMDEAVWRAKRAAFKYPHFSKRDRLDYAQQKEQYPASNEKVRQLMRGEVDRIDVMWRCDLGRDMELFEIEVTSHSHSHYATSHPQSGGTDSCTSVCVTSCVRWPLG